jgi:NAD(P) transhydrogenase subunit alpha
MELVDPIVFRLTIFVLAIFVGYFVVWSVTPALHTPLMAVTNAISSVIVVGALIAVSVNTTPLPRNVTVAVDRNSNVTIDGRTTPSSEVMNSLKRIEKTGVSEVAAFKRAAWTSKVLGFIALILASVNIFGGFLVTQRMLAMYKKKG